MRNRSTSNFTKAVDYLFHKAVSDRNKAELSLNLLMNNGVGIGDHSTGDFWSNLDEALDALVDAEDRLEVIEERFGRSEDEEEPPF
ncbi:MAG: hypothetical protein FI729_03335 [SAR202 cluster bacterium]|nr:hypothetical protein [SAR202 cluster bacterium]